MMHLKAWLADTRCAGRRISYARGDMATGRRVYDARGGVATGRPDVRVDMATGRLSAVSDAFLSLLRNIASSIF